jgi:hypothetical protein
LRPGRVNNSHFFISSRLALGPAQPYVQLVPGVNGQGVELITRLQLVLRKENVDLLNHSPIRLHDVVLSKAQKWLYRFASSGQVYLSVMVAKFIMRECAVT